MLRILVIFFILNFYIPALSSSKEKVVNWMQLTDNLSFDFIQTVDDKNENGRCIINYPKKIWCEYNNSNKKIIISNGRSLVIKTKNKGSYYRYPLNKTPLIFLLDKQYLLSKMNTLEPREIDDKYLNFTISEKNIKINIFFDKENVSLIGWQTEDIYKNLTITYISSLRINQKIDNKIFILPEND